MYELLIMSLNRKFRQNRSPIHDIKPFRGMILFVNLCLDVKCFVNWTFFFLVYIYKNKNKKEVRGNSRNMEKEVKI